MKKQNILLTIFTMFEKTAIRPLLNKGADVDEALNLLEKYDMHALMGAMTYPAIADNDGNSAAVEYIGSEMQAGKIIL